MRSLAQSHPTFKQTLTDGKDIFRYIVLSPEDLAFEAGVGSSCCGFYIWALDSISNV